jgi:hypothetical protein
VSTTINIAKCPLYLNSAKHYSQSVQPNSNSTRQFENARHLNANIEIIMLSHNWRATFSIKKSSSSIVLTRLSEPRFRPTTSQKIWQNRESNPDLWICSQEQTTGPQRRSFLSYLTKNTLLLCYTYHSVNSSVVLTRFSEPRFRPTTSQKIWQNRESNPDLWICNQELWPLDHRGSRHNKGRIIICTSVQISVFSQPILVHRLL